MNTMLEGNPHLLANCLYTCYCVSVGGKMPPWPDLVNDPSKKHLANAWLAVAHMVREMSTEPPAPEVEEVTVTEFINALANGDSNDDEIEKLQDAVKEADDMLDSLGLSEDYGARLYRILHPKAEE